MKKGILYTVLFTLLISFFFVFILSTVNELTKGITERNKELFLRKAVLTAFHIPFNNNEEAYTLFDEEITPVDNRTDLFMYEQEGVPVYAILFQDMALWGDVRGILAVDKDVTKIIGVEFISHNETPGLGGRIDEDAYKNQFRGEFVGVEGLIKGTRKGVYDYDHQNGEVDGISGATRTSTSIEKIINKQLTRIRKLLEVH